MHLNRTRRETECIAHRRTGTSISIAEQERPKCKQTGGKRITSRKSEGGWHRKLFCRAVEDDGLRRRRDHLRHVGRAN